MLSLPFLITPDLFFSALSKLLAGPFPSSELGNVAIPLGLLEPLGSEHWGGYFSVPANLSEPSTYFKSCVGFFFAFFFQRYKGI